MPEPLALGFDTSLAHCSAALLCGDRVLTSRSEAMGKGQAERLFPMLHEMLSEYGHAWQDVDVIGVGTGPGNFTGIRVSVAAARGLALSLKIPVIGVTVTEAAAYGLPRPCRVIIPSRHDQVFWQDFGDDAGTPKQSASDMLPAGPPVYASMVPPAEAITRIAMQKRCLPADRPVPTYLRPADALPPREAAPLILT